MKKIEKILIILHGAISVICSMFYFEKLMIDVGSENQAVSLVRTGSDLSKDFLSRMLCVGFSFVLAMVFIALFWRVVFRLKEQMKENDKSGLPKIFIWGCGIILILLLYPKMYGVETMDDYMNLVYAMEFLPMYWHGFWTNVVYCACMICFPHPVIVPIIQFGFATYVVDYIAKGLRKGITGRKKVLFYGITVILTVPLFPELIRIFIYPTRNCMYAILCLYGISILFSDYQEKRKLTKKRFLSLCFVFAIMGCWRGEGILYMVAFPLLIYVVYFSFQKTQKKYVDSMKGNCNKAKMGKGLLVYVFICLLLMLPDKYGGAKYQNSDYMIANTTGPLSAIYMNEKANLTYAGAKEDAQNIERIIPIEHIKRYGCNSGFYYNAQNGRFVRQSGSTKEEGSAYVRAAFRIMAYNWPIWLKYQTNLFFEAIQVKEYRFVINYGEETLENWRELKPYIRAFDLYNRGEEFLQTKEVLTENTEADKKLEERMHELLDGLYGIVRSRMVGYKFVLIIATIVGTVVMALRKNWLTVLFMLINLAVLGAVILMAPWGRANYYYSVFINMHVVLLWSGVTMMNREQIALQK